MFQHSKDIIVLSSGKKSWTVEINDHGDIW